MPNNNDLDKIAKAFANSKSGSSKKTSNSSNGKNYWGKNYYKNPDLVSNSSNNKNASSGGKSTSKKTNSSGKSSTSKSGVNKAISSSVNSTLNKSISNTINNSTNLSSSQSSAVTKQIKKLPLKSKICIVLLFIIGVLIGLGSCYLICRNDQFEIIGQKNITLSIGETYTDEGVKVIGFGKDMSSSVTIEVYKNGAKISNNSTNLDTSEECIYQIMYKLNNFRFRDVQIIRTINVIPVDSLGAEISLFGVVDENPDGTDGGDKLEQTVQSLIGDGTNESKIEHIYISSDGIIYILVKDSQYAVDNIQTTCDYNSCLIESDDYTKLKALVDSYNNNKDDANWITVTLVTESV